MTIYRTSRPLDHVRPAPPMIEAGPRQIVVGVDGSPDNRVALDWACVRAQAGQATLHIVHAFRWPAAFDPYGITVLVEARPLELAKRIVGVAAGHARAITPELDITTCVLAMGPVAALRREGHRAELVVVGRSRRRRRPLNKSVGLRVAVRAQGRVVIVGFDEEVLV